MAVRRQACPRSHYYDGLGVELDHRSAAYWFRRVAEQGNAEAQYALYNMLMQGLGVVQDKVAAFVWAKYAAEQGYPGGEQAWTHPDWRLSEAQQQQALRAVEAGRWPKRPVFTEAEERAIASAEPARKG